VGVSVGVWVGRYVRIMSHFLCFYSHAHAIAWRSAASVALLRGRPNQRRSASRSDSSESANRSPNADEGPCDATASGVLRGSAAFVRHSRCSGKPSR
jgi:hypothetical protein